MKKFLLHIFLFLFIISLLFSIIVLFSDKGLRQSNFDNLEEWNSIFDGDMNADVIIQGTSRAKWHFDPAIIDSGLNVISYNLGMDGESFDVQYVRYKTYIKYNKKPDLIIQNVDWATFSRNESLYNKYQFLPYTSDKDFRKLLIKNVEIPKSDLYFPLLKYSGEFKAVMVGFMELMGKHYVSPSKYKGYYGEDRKWEGDIFEKRGGREIVDWVREEDLETLFNVFLDDCRENEIKVLLVLVPPYFKSRHPVDYSVMIPYYEKLAENKDVTFLNYYFNPLSENKELFYNATHLNRKGAERLSREVVKDIQSLHFFE